MECCYRDLVRIQPKEHSWGPPLMFSSCQFLPEVLDAEGVRALCIFLNYPGKQINTIDKQKAGQTGGYEPRWPQLFTAPSACTQGGQPNRNKHTLQTQLKQSFSERNVCIQTDRPLNSPLWVSLSLSIHTHTHKKNVHTGCQLCRQWSKQSSSKYYARSCEQFTAKLCHIELDPGISCRQWCKRTKNGHKM